MLLCLAVGCDATPAPNARPAPPIPKRQAKPLSALEARRIVEDVNRRLDADGKDAAFWHTAAEGPWLDLLLAKVENTAKHGGKAPPAPTNTPEVSPGVEVWPASSNAPGDRWILGSFETSSWTISSEGVKKPKTATPTWTLYHQQGEGPWRQTFQVHVSAGSGVPRPAVGNDGQAVTGGDTTKLAVPPSSVCGHMADYVAGTNDAQTRKSRWSKEITADRAEFAGIEQSLRERLGAKSVDVTSTTVRTPHGPVWRTADGSALVACVTVNQTAIDMGPGRYSVFPTSGWSGTTGIRWTSYTQSLMVMNVLKIPAGHGEVSVAAKSAWPYKFDGKRHTGR
ncbi:hypothetical protein [Streptomyces hydrogenans]|uniref:hypothetical protein n=1 Tax=Streptomyces hydrogenans TaxID=1873719 RepID=UPI0035D93798